MITESFFYSPLGTGVDLAEVVGYGPKEGRPDLTEVVLKNGSRLTLSYYPAHFGQELKKYRDSLPGN